MRIGIDLSERQISVVLLHGEVILKAIDVSIYSAKRDTNKIIVAKMLDAIHKMCTPFVKHIGLSLPSVYDKNKGVMYDIRKIPYWKKVKIKHIIEEEFNVPVYVNLDINCFILGEKFHGLNQGFSNAVGIILDNKVDVGLIVNNRLFSDLQASFTDVNCLSAAYYDYIRLYHQSYERTCFEVQDICGDFSEELMCIPTHKIWEDLGNSIGRLISILLVNYDFSNIILGGRWAGCLTYFSGHMDSYLKTKLSPSTILNMIITISQVKHPRALGACYINSYKKSMQISIGAI
jgi:Transcriptional regulator/sugar kinase